MKSNETQAMSNRSLTFRMAASEDNVALGRLAALDSARPLSGRMMLAELEGVPVAAISLESGSVIADPFQHSAHAVDMLKLRRRHLTRGADRSQAAAWPRVGYPGPASAHADGR